jgi:hypothetical protein
LSAKAKQEKRFRFYSLYGLVSHPETLREAWAQVRAKRGAPGVDGVTIGQIEREGEEAFLEVLGRELAGKTAPCRNGAAGLHPQGEREDEAARNPEGEGPGGADGRRVHPGADI